ncbi:RNA polymerase sigma-70 factor [uncultured Chitinophaga sp.]|uniref:RNA polymerase sigma-70 factor n=1 Tax=uncultured Chitinophaga sp. TaxID=339340 RepID=UPI0025DC96ED|nr:RNA polymerase sigma-70 factor [uncultured Chitinophaga sp.]
MGAVSGRQSNSEERFNQLFNTCRERVFGFVFLIAKDHDAAEELTQEIFLKLWICRDTLHEIDNPEAYLFTIARNKTLNYLRKAANDVQFMKELASRMTPARNDVEETVISREYDQLLHQGVAQLSPQRRMVYELSRTEGLNHEEIAYKLNISKNTVKNHLVKTLMFLRRYLLENTAHTSVILAFLLFR